VKSIFSKHGRYIILVLFLIVGGLGNSVYPVFLFFLFLSGIYAFRKRLNIDFVKEAKLPPRFLFYLIFLILFAISLLWSRDVGISILALYLYISGMLFWLILYTKPLKKFENAIIVVGLLFGALTLVNMLFASPGVNPFSLFEFAVAPLHHHHIGDVWAVVLIILGLKLKDRGNMKIWLAILLGFSLVFISLSRSAYIALIASSLYIIWLFRSTKRNVAIFWLFIVVSLVLFFYAATQKSTLISHIGYYLTGTLTIAKNPLGVGVGNFREASTDYARILLGNMESVGSAHNIILEIISGMGVLGLSFAIWLGLVVVVDILKNRGIENVLWKAIFISISVNFMFDYTYLIPTMFWLWFIALGLSQKQ
jgi:hypothetical protein